MHRRLLYILAVFLTAVCPVLAQTTNAMASNNNWTNAAAWSLAHVPSGAETVEIQAGVTANASTSPTNDYTGDLILRANAEVYQWSAGWIGNCLPADTNSTIYMFNGSQLLTRHGNSGLTTDNPIVVDGAVTIAKGSYYNAQDWEIRSVISGAGSVTFFFTDSSSPAANREIFLRPSSPSTYSGGTTVTNGLAVKDREQVVRVYANGAFGTGDLTIQGESRVDLEGTTDVIADSATLNIADTGILDMNSSSETVNELSVEGVQYPAGSYTSSKLDRLLGGGTLTVLSPVDTNAPTFNSFTNDVAGGPVSELDHVINYTVSFADDFSLMDPTTVTASDFTNAGTATVSFGPVTQLSGTSFNVIVYIQSAGTIQVEIPAGSNIEDMAGNAMDTASAITDSTVITVTPFIPPGDASRMTPVFHSSTTGVADASIVVNFDASGSDKLVVTVTGEHGFSGNLGGNCTDITYDGVSLTKAVERNPIATSPSGPIDQLYNDIWYLDDPGSVHTGGTIIATVTSRGVLTAFTLSNVAPGVGGTAVSAQELKYVRLGAEYKKSIVIATHGMGGDGNTADVSPVDTVPPLIETSAIRSGGQYNGHVTGLMTNLSQGVVVPTFTGGNTIGTHTIAAEFPALPAPGLIIIVR